MSRADELRALLARVENSDADSGLESAIWIALVPDDPEYQAWQIRRRVSWAAPTIMRSVDAARSLVRRVLPDWWVSSGLCALSGHASIGPDYNGPAGDRLRAEWPEERYHEGFHADLKPGDGPHRECLALIHALLSALIAREEDHGR